MTFSFEMTGMELSVYVKTLDVFLLLQIEMLLLISQMLKNGQVCSYSLLLAIIDSISWHYMRNNNQVTFQNSSDHSAIRVWLHKETSKLAVSIADIFQTYTGLINTIITEAVWYS